MSWTVTLEVVDCASPSTLISGAHITAGTYSLGYTDANGQRIIIDDLNIWEWVILTISKPGTEVCNPAHPNHHPGYISKNFTIHRDMDGTIQTVCLNQAPLPDCDGTGPTFDCFIVTAATGSPESVEATRLRELRDRVGAASRLAAQLIDLVYGEYKEFSPGIAAELRRDGIVREAVLRMVVRPLFAWYTLAGTLAFEGADRKAVGRAAREVSNACPKYLGGTIIPFLEAIRAKEELPANTPRVLLDLAPRVAHLRFASWAILDPLVRAWRSATDRLDVVDEVGRWLADAPLEALSPSDDTGLLDRELGVLARFLDFRPTARARLGERLRTAWPHAAVALEQAGFVRQSPN
jgi:hypothetical protein